MTAEPSDSVIEATSAARAYAFGDLAEVWGAPHVGGRAGRILGLIAHPSTADLKIRALEAHRTQYALDPELLPRRVLHELLRSEHFALAVPGRAEPI